MEPSERPTHAPERSPGPGIGDQAQRKTVDQRRQSFARAIHMEVAHGGRIESQGDLEAVIVLSHINHRLHLILTILTCGLWAFVWLPLALLRGRKKRQVINVDKFGRITITPADVELAADISSAIGAPQHAGTFVNPKGLTKSSAIGEAASQVGGGPAEVLAGKIAGAVGSAVASTLTDVAHAIYRKRRAPEEHEDQASEVVYVGTPSFDTIAYLAVSVDEVLIVQANTDMTRWAKIGPEVFGRGARSAVASAELDPGRWISALRIGFADGERWEFDVRSPHRDTAEQVARALGAGVG